MSFVAVMSVCGLMLGVATLIVVLSVMNGFERELRSRMLAVTAHATLSGLSGSLTDWQALQSQVRRQAHVQAAVPYVESQAMFANGTRMAGASVRGVLPEEERTATGLAQRVESGSLADLTPGGYGIILGSALAARAQRAARRHGGADRARGHGHPDRRGAAHAPLPRRRARSTRACTSSTADWRWCTWRTRRGCFASAASVTGLRLAFDEPLRAPHAGAAGGAALGGPGFYVSDWTEDHANFFRSIEITKSMMFMILLMIVAVAAFNIVATLVMIVKEKQTDIAILRTLGAAPRNVLLMFAVQGVLIGLAGTAARAPRSVRCWPTTCEALVGALEHLLGTQFLDARVYYMSDLPAYVETGDVLRVGAVAFLLCVLATHLPGVARGAHRPCGGSAP